jgi:hypothetical protein
MSTVSQNDEFDERRLETPTIGRAIKGVRRFDVKLIPDKEYTMALYNN